MTSRILHLLDDQTAGGVTRFVDCLLSEPEIVAGATHEIVPLRRNSWSAPAFDADLIVSHLTVSWRMLPMLLALRARNPRTRIVHVEHSYAAGFMDLEVRSKARFTTLLRTAYAMFETVVAVSAAQANWMLSEELVAPEALRVVPPMVDLAPFLALEPARHSPRRIAAIGRLEEIKGFDVLIRAFRATADADMELHIHGCGPARVELEMFASGDPRVRFHGFSDPVFALAHCDVVAVPSRRECYGLVAQEARAAGRLVLVSGADGLRDQVADGAVLVGQSFHDWCAAIENLAAMHSPERVAVARTRTIERVRTSVAAWRALCASRNSAADVPIAAG